MNCTKTGWELDSASVTIVYQPCSKPRGLQRIENILSHELRLSILGFLSTLEQEKLEGHVENIKVAYKEVVAWGKKS